MRILFTGGSGKAGRHVVPYLVGAGHHVTNIDLQPLDGEGVENRRADISDSGAVWGALTDYASLKDIGEGGPTGPFEAVVHFAAIPAIGLVPDCETFRINALGTHNVLEAATKLGVPKIVLASSETTYGTCFADGHRPPPAIPITEDLPTEPMDSYALSKVCNEVTARGMQRRSGADVYALRIGNVIEPHEYDTLFPAFITDPDQRYRNAFNYIDARDLGQIVELCLRTNALGYQVFNAANDGNSVALSTPEIVARYYAGVTQTRELGDWEGIYSNAKIRDVLGFREDHPWRRYVDAPGKT